MGVLNNLKNIRNIYCNRREIKMVQINNKIVYQSDNVGSTYNYFVFDTSLGDGTTRLALQDSRAGDTTEWDGFTDWGDGTVDTALTHTYATHGIYTVKTKWILRKKGIDVGGYYIDSNASKMFVGCNGINRRITEVTYILRDFPNLRYVDLSNFKTDHITYMNNMFAGCKSLEELNMEGWDTSNVTDMRSMFAGCVKLTPKVSHFNTSKVTDMSFMFSRCKNIDGSQFKDWDVSNVIYLNGMFNGASELLGNPGSAITNCLDLSNWDVSNVIRFDDMFHYCQANDGIDISGWNINDTRVNVQEMFANTTCSTCADIEHHVKHDGVPDEDWQRMITG